MITTLSKPKLQVQRFLLSGAAIVLLCIYLATTQTLAQTSLQNTGGAPLQQSGQTQPTNNSQAQTGTPQANNGQSVLNQRSTQSLGVVSDPTQTTPEAVANPSQTLKADVAAEKTSNTLPASILLGLLAALSGLAIITGWLYGRRQADEEVALEEESEFTPEPSKPFKKQKRPKKKRKKPHQR